MRCPLGLQDFRGLREAGLAYVDKTAHVAAAMDVSKYLFLARPRRFGKSLLVSTLNELYSGDRELFAGLWAYDHWDFASKATPVIWVQFASMPFEEFGAAAAAMEAVRVNARRLGVGLPETTSVKVAFGALIRGAAAKSPYGKTVVLVDEYDKPITHALERDTDGTEATPRNPAAEEQRDALKPFYGVLKDADPFLELVFITGVSAFLKVSLFSELNNVVNLSLDPVAETLCGITERELLSDFGEALHETGVPIEEVRSYYNGYAFGPNAERVYNPWSVWSFLQSGRLAEQWYATGTPSWLVRLMAHRGVADIAGERRNRRSLLRFDLRLRDIPSVLYQTGYLTLATFDPETDLYTLDFPNLQVRAAFDAALLDAYTEDGYDEPQVRLTNLRRALQHGDLAAVMALIDAALADVPYPLWERHGERTYHLITHVLFRALGAYVTSEVSRARGRADAIVETAERVYCFEFKVDAGATSALQQIRERGYLDGHRASGKTLVAVGVSFDRGRRMVGTWEEAVVA